MFEENPWQLEDIEFGLTKYQNAINWNGGKILHFGCGSGFVTRKLLLTNLPETIERVVAVDRSNDSIKFALEFYRHAKVSYEKISEFNVHGCFDHIFSFYTNEMHNKSFYEMAYAHLASHGDLLLIGLNSHLLIDMYNETIKSDKWKNIVHCSNKNDNFHKTKEEYEALLSGVGFRNVVYEEHAKSQIFPNQQALKKFFSTLVNLKEIPQHFLDDFITDCLYSQAALGNVEYFGHDGKIISIPYRYVIVYAQKSKC